MSDPGFWSSIPHGSLTWWFAVGGNLFAIAFGVLIIAIIIRNRRR